ncbi:glycosyltransferase [Treponema brennaborense]|uniref:Glycosyl transferase family 2 n=1 Tax=Treponema brennaborense (strain DSM 12168 / CIP 105900 / DD5/3) TaxID=906968 RepID=F4LMI0_TREBD|nr:glycosyltransferase [Treponema brennaborense]AEE15742.1 glycosyl transferase family 2 [Treponema brennaborense DSM 12168]
MKEISIVIPVYNSASCVKKLTEQIAESLRGFEYEQIMVNDCSKDTSWQEINSVIDQGFPVIGINLRKNSGQDNAIFAGLQAAAGRYVVIMDDDLQHSPADIIKLYDNIKNGADVCYADFPRKKQRLWKNVGSWLNGKCAEIVISKPKGLYLSPFKILKSEIVREILKTHSLYPYIDGLIFQVTKNIIQIPIEHHDRDSGKSNYNLIKSIKVFSKLVFGFSVIPLRISSYLGCVSAIAGFILGIYYLFEYFMGKVEVAGWTTIVILILFVGGLNLLSLGIIGEYIGRSYLTINNCPRFTVSEIRKNEK